MESHEEQQYLNLVRRVLETGNEKQDRTGVGTLSVFGPQLCFSLRTSFPLLTTKRLFWRGIVEELLWFLRGETNSFQLSRKGVHIWDFYGGRDYLDQHNLQSYVVGDVGPIYGFQWRHFGANYYGYQYEYIGKGIDQIYFIITTLRNDPDSRRMILTAWNPMQMHQMSLPPCHVLCQFYVANGELSCHVYQRSADIGLGLPFNIASYALLTCLLAHVTGWKPGDLIHTMGDAHIYKSHIHALEEQQKRTPSAFPTLNIYSNKLNLEEYEFSDFQLDGYDPHERIFMSMAI